jgi:thiol-disulfide isomerase/thioredoxin
MKGRTQLWITLSLCLLIIATTSASAQNRQLGILQQTAPSWEVTQWMQLPKGKANLDVNDFKGKVLYLYCFQAWCPGCHSHGFPTLQKLAAHYQNDPDVAFVAIQTTFEGYSFNTFGKTHDIASRYHLSMPIGQSGDAGEASSLMRHYRTGGTPWTILIDKQGVVRFNDFHVEPAAAIRMIDVLKRS